MAAARGMLGRYPFGAVGAGDPLLVLAGLSPTTGAMSGRGLRITIGPLADLATARRLIVLNRRPGLPRGMTMAELAAEHAEAITTGLGAPVDIVGMSTGGSIAQQPAAVLASVLGPLLIRDAQGLDDMATTIEAEDEFDLARCRAPIHAPTLIVAGADDRFYSPELFHETARLIPDSRLCLVEGRGHVTVMSDRHAKAELTAFLKAGA
jgi:pimeloyl-ACP methyl ester carboxylesterase